MARHPSSRSNETRPRSVPFVASTEEYLPAYTHASHGVCVAPYSPESRRCRAVRRVGPGARAYL